MLSTQVDLQSLINFDHSNPSYDNDEEGLRQCLVVLISDSGFKAETP